MKGAIIDKQVKEMVEQGLAVESNSPWASPVVLARKKDNTYRLCINLQKVNAVTKKDAYPLPRVDTCLSRLQGNQFFSVLDMASGYWQVPLTDRAKPKTAFVTEGGQYEMTVMPFGLCNAPATFVRLMNKVLDGLLGSALLAYLDDVIVLGKDFKEHLDNLRSAFGRFRAYGLKLKPSKCSLFAQSVSFLGFVVTPSGTKVDPARTSAIEHWAEPRDVTGIKSFVGSASYYRRHIQGFSNLVAPLVRLTRKGIPFQWTEDCQVAFDSIKQKLMQAPILSHPQPEGELILDTDASSYGVGAVLNQIQNGEEKVLCYASKSLNKAQMNYCTSMREMLAVVEFIRHFRSFLWGRPFKVRTDHASLVWLKNFRDSEGLLARWNTTLEQFDFQICYRKATQHTNADGLSRARRRTCKWPECPKCTQKKSHEAKAQLRALRPPKLPAE